MFYTHRTPRNLKLVGSYRELLTHELAKHRGKETTIFWSPGFRILQHIENRMAMDKNLRRAKDPVKINTKCMAPENNESISTCETNECSAIDDTLD